jgi:hypothetical protein
MRTPRDTSTRARRLRPPTGTHWEAALGTQSGDGRMAAKRFSHEALLTLARKVRAAASDGDLERLQHAVQHLLGALDDHLSGESGALGDLPADQARILGRGQATLLTAAKTLASASTDGCPVSRARCADRAEELVALLSLQARDERMTWPGRAA